MWEIIQKNRRKSYFMVFLMAVLLIITGFFAGFTIIGPGGEILGVIIAVIIWAILFVVGMTNGANILMSVSRAHPIKKEDFPRLFNVVEEMTIASQLPKMPDIYLIDDPSPNAFATGKNPENSAIAVTSGLIYRLNRDQLQGVVAHELAHIKNHDIFYMTMMGVMAGAIVLISDFTLRTLFWTGGSRRRTSSSEGGQIQSIILIVGLLMMALSPIFARFIYFASSRKREYLADASAAVFTRFPEGLASALELIGYSPVKMKKILKTIAPMYTVNPIIKLNSASIFSTHPPIPSRVKILRGMAGGAGYIDYDRAYRGVSGAKASVIPPSAFKDHAPVAIRAAAPQEHADLGIQPATQAAGSSLIGALAAVSEEESLASKVRETTDAMWKSQEYLFIDCDCGARLKIPPTLKGRKIPCLRCMRGHQLI